MAAVLAAIGIGAWWLSRGFPASALHETWLVLRGPMWIGLMSIIAGRLWKAFQQSDVSDPSNTRMGSRFAVGHSVSLLFTLTTMLFSFLWLVGHHVGASNPNWLISSILGLSTCGLVLAVARLWEPLPGKRGLAVYLNVISLGLVCAKSFSSWGELPRLQSWLI